MARAYSRTLPELMAEPYAALLWAFLQLREAEAMERVIAHGTALDAASLTAIAYHDPKQLAGLEQRYRREVGLAAFDEAVEREVERERVARARALAAEIMGSGVLSDVTEAARAPVSAPEVSRGD